MARRKKTSTAEDVMELVAMLPWWAGVALAVVSYLVLHKMAAVPVLPPGATPAQAVGLGPRAMLAAIATAAQYLVPILCLFGALGSFLRRRKRQSLALQVTRSGSADALNGMTWREFEMLVGQAFRQQGYAVEEKGGSAPDGGIDLVLRKEGESYLVQCKQWKAFKVGVDVVRELYGVMAARGAAGGFVVTSGSFTTEAKAFAEGRNIRLVAGDHLFSLLQRAKSVVAETKPAARAVPAPAAAVVETVQRAPACPRCNAQMVLRTASKGANAGSRFWGCSTFPKCRGTRAEVA